MVGTDSGGGELTSCCNRRSERRCESDEQSRDCACHFGFGSCSGSDQAPLNEIRLITRYEQGPQNKSNNPTDGARRIGYCFAQQGTGCFESRSTNPFPGRSRTWRQLVPRLPLYLPGLNLL